eukprot:jgi/Psemu1/43088/gm1.43088_g
MEQGSVREFRSREEVRQVVSGARDVIPKGDIVKEALVQRLEPEEVGCRACGGSGAFALPIDSCCVVIAVVGGAGVDTSSLSQNIIVGNGTGELKTPLLAGNSASSLQMDNTPAYCDLWDKALCPDIDNKSVMKAVEAQTTPPPVERKAVMSSDVPNQQRMKPAFKPTRSSTTRTSDLREIQSLRSGDLLSPSSKASESLMGTPPPPPPLRMLHALGGWDTKKDTTPSSGLTVANQSQSSTCPITSKLSDDDTIVRTQSINPAEMARFQLDLANLVRATQRWA